MPTALFEADGPLAPPPLQRARALLADALAILDAEGARPDLGARIQHVIDELDGDASE